MITFDSEISLLVESGLTSPTLASAVWQVKVQTSHFFLPHTR